MSFPTPDQLCIRFNEITLPTDNNSSSSSFVAGSSGHDECSGDDKSSGAGSSGDESSIGFDLLFVEVARDASEFRPVDGSHEAQKGVDRITHYFHGQQDFVLGTLLRHPKCRSVPPWSCPEPSTTSDHDVSDIKKRRARGVKYDSDEDIRDAEKMPHEFDYSSAEEGAVKSANEGDQDNYETPPRKKRCIE